MFQFLYILSNTCYFLFCRGCVFVFAYVTAILVCVKYLIIVLIYISLMTSDVDLEMPLFGFGIKVILASQNELESSISLEDFENIIGVNSLSVW